MPEIKLTKLPDRTLVKLTISISPSLKRALDDYAAIYCQTYGTNEPISEIVPHMLESFLTGDRGFQKARSSLHVDDT